MAAASKTCFVICPIGPDSSDVRDRADWVLHGIVIPALSDKDIFVERADLIDVPGNISTQVVSKVQECDLVIADLTDHNPNVFYELAIRHCSAKPVIHMAKFGTSLPFDINDHRTIFYDLRNPSRMAQAVDRLRSAYDECMKPDFSPSNPVSNAKALKSIHADKNALKIIEKLQKENAELHHEKVRLSGIIAQRDRIAENYGRIGTLSTVGSPQGGILSALAGLDQDSISRNFDLAVSRTAEIEKILAENKNIEDRMLRQKAQGLGGLASVRASTFVEKNEDKKP